MADMRVDAPGPPVYRTAAEHVEPSLTAVMTGYRRECERLRAPVLFVMSETYLTVRTADGEVAEVEQFLRRVDDPGMMPR